MKTTLKNGFTLLELLVVIAVIGILAALLLPVLSRGKDKALNATCVSNLKQWGVTWRLYADDNNDSFMCGTITDWPRGEWVLSFADFYKKNPTLLLCPKAAGRRGPGDHETHTFLDDPNATQYGGPTTAYAFPIGDPRVSSRLLIASYGLNSWVYNPDTNSIQGRLAVFNWRKFSAASQPTVIPLFLDSMWRGGGPNPADTPPDFNGQFTSYDDEFHNFAIARHGKGINVLYFDGSVRYTRAKDLWGLKWSKGYDLSAANNTRFPAWMN